MKEIKMVGGPGAAIDLLKQRVRDFLPQFPSKNDASLAVILVVYADLIGSNFVPWMAKTWVIAQTAAAKTACYDNLKCEVNDDHPSMLRQFVADIALGKFNKLTAARLIRMQVASTVVQLISVRVSISPVYGLMLMTALENASLVFIPWMQEAAQRLEITDQTYLKVHGEADIDHAMSFLEALKLEMEFHSQGAILEAQRAVNDVEHLLMAIFAQ